MIGRANNDEGRNGRNRNGGDANGEHGGSDATAHPTYREIFANDPAIPATSWSVGLEDEPVEDFDPVSDVPDEVDEDVAAVEEAFA